MQTVRDLLSRDLSKPIEEVVKVSQQDEKTVHDEILEYVATDRIKRQYIDVLKPIADAPGDPTEGIGVWVSGFFGSGKSSFAKILGYILANRQLLGEEASKLFLDQLWEQVRQTPTLDDDKLVQRIQDNLKFINASYPAHVMMFDVQVDRAVRRSTEPIAEIMYTVLLRELDYAEDYDVANLEIELEREGRLADFVQAAADLYGDSVRNATPADTLPLTLDGISAEAYGVWQQVRKGAQRINRASAALHAIDPGTYPEADSWAKSLNKDADIKIRDLVGRTFELSARRKPGYGIVFIIDEVGAYVARSAEKIENLRAVVEQFGQESKNRVHSGEAVAPVWVIVTSQEKLDEVVAAIDDKRVELAKMQDRFPHRVDMAPADIREVATRRVLAKTKEAEQLLAAEFKKANSELRTHTRLERTSRHSEVDQDTFIQHYPYLPHFIDMSIDIVSGIRLTGGGPRHIGGSNRTIIKQAYEMLVSERTDLANKPVGALVTMDRIYDLVEGNLPSEKQKDISEIGSRWSSDPWPARTAKAIALLEYVRDVPVTDANIAALLYRELGAASPLPEVERSAKLLEEGQFIRQTENGWKLQTEQEKSWTAERNAFNPNPRERNELVEDRLKSIYEASELTRYRYKNKRNFRVGVSWENRRLTSGDAQIPLTLLLADGPDELGAVADRARDDSRSPEHKNDIYWIASLTSEIDDIVVELFRSRQMVGRYNQLRAQGKITNEESASLSNEKTTVLRLEERLKSRLQEALTSGRGYFRGVEKTGASLGRSLGEIQKALFDYAVPKLYPKLEMGSRPLKGNEAEEILKAANLSGLPEVFYGPPKGLELVVKEGSKFVINSQAEILKEVDAYLNREHGYGNKVTGKLLENHLGGLGYGWELDVIRLAMATLLRGGSLEVTYQGRRYRNHLDPQVRIPLSGTQAFRAASFAPRRSIDLQTLVKAVQRYEELTGDEVDVEETAIALAFQSLAREELEALLPVKATVQANNIHVDDVLEEYQQTLDTVLNSLSDDAVLMLAVEGASFQRMRDQVERIRRGTDAAGLARLRRARETLNEIIRILDGELGEERFSEEKELLTSYLDAGGIGYAASQIDSALDEVKQVYDGLYRTRHEMRREGYVGAVQAIRNHPDWPKHEHEDSADTDKSLAEKDLDAKLDSWLEPLLKHVHGLEMSSLDSACTECHSSLSEMSSDLMAIEGLKRQAIDAARMLIPLSETVKRVNLMEIAGQGLSLRTRDEVDSLIEELRKELYGLLDDENEIILG